MPKAEVKVAGFDSGQNVRYILNLFLRTNTYTGTSSGRQSGVRKVWPAVFKVSDAEIEFSNMTRIQGYKDIYSPMT